MTVPESPPPDTHVRVPLSAQQLTWIADQAEARNTSRRALMRYLIQRFKTADERMHQHDESRSSDTRGADAAGSATSRDDETAASMFDFSDSDEEVPPSMFDFLDKEDQADG